MKEAQSPANPPLELPKGYRPMSSPTLRLETPQKPGWHRHWFRGVPNRIARALQAGYRYVDSKDCDINSFDLAGDSLAGGSTDLGTRVSVVSGDGTNETGQPSRMYLMECPEELYKYSRSLLEKESDKIATSLKGGIVGMGVQGETSEDQKNRYISSKMKHSNLFTKKT